MPAPDCQAPDACPVPDPPGRVDARRLRTLVWPADRPFFHVYELHRGCDTFNPGLGDTRFAPLMASEQAAAPVPTLYGGADEPLALLESIFHDMSRTSGRVIYEPMLRERGIAHLVAPRALRLIDLRDDALAGLGLSRAQLIATSAAHYPCTRSWAAWLHGRRPGGRAPDGLAWSSRQAELTGSPNREVLVLWGDRAPSRAGSYELVGPGVRNLVEGAGRVLVEEIAESLGAVVEPG